MSRWRSPALSTAFWAWMEYMDSARQERKEAALEEARKHLAGESEATHKAKRELELVVQSEKERRVEQAQRIVRRMLHSQLAGAFDSYLDRTVAMREKRVACVRVVKRMLHTHLAAAFDQFTEAIEQLKAHRQLVERAMARWRSSASTRSCPSRRTGRR